MLTLGLRPKVISGVFQSMFFFLLIKEVSDLFGTELEDYD